MIHDIDEMGAHVSASGGVDLAPGRAHGIDAAVLQLFTKQPSRWAESVIDEKTAQAFKAAREEHGISVAGAHDSYLINLSTPDRRLWRMSQRSFQAELARCALLELDFLVTHPGNATDKDYEMVYHVLQDGGGDGGDSVLDISDSKRLSLLDILKEEELSFKKTFVPRAA